MRKIEILCTLGPKSLSKSFLKLINNKVNLVRLNLSHIKISNLKNIIKFVKKNTRVPICIDTEGAQIRTKITGENKKFLIGEKGYIYNKIGNFKLYPNDVYNELKKMTFLISALKD